MSSASAWNEEKGHGQIIVTSSFLNTSRSFDSNGDSHLFPDGGSFRQYAVYTYFEYGLTNRFNFVANVALPFLGYSNTFGSQSSAGFGDVEVGLRYRLNSRESRWATSLQLVTKFPAYPAARNPAPGNHQEDVEIRFLAGRGSKWAGHDVFWDAEGAYRYRSGDPADQLRGDLTGGIHISQRWMAMLQLFSIRSLRNGAPLTTTNPNAQSDFDLYKGQASLVLTVTSKTRLQAGWTNAFAGRNTGRDHSIIFAVWRNF